MMTTLPTRHAALSLALSCFTVLVAASLASAQGPSLEFPYQALVAKDNALVRSGPGEVHYGTQKLAAGQVVEVYRHDPDGWCAIRPVEGSFCIIPESTVEIISEGVGEIKMAGTTPFVGTKLGTVKKPLWQVKLHEKEKVSLIGQLSWPNPEGHSTVWYQIKPPAGEFRWINISNLESLAGETMASVIQPKPTQATPTEKAVPTTTPTPPPKTIASLPTAESRPAADFAAQPSVTPVKPSYDSATAQQQPSQNAQPNRPITSQTDEGAVEPNDFAADQTQVQLASFAPTTPTEPTTPPLQDSGTGWRRATRAIPSISVSKSSSDRFEQSATANDNRSQFDSASNYYNSNYNNNSNYQSSNLQQLELHKSESAKL